MPTTDPDATATDPDWVTPGGPAAIVRRRDGLRWSATPVTIARLTNTQIVLGDPRGRFPRATRTRRPGTCTPDGTLVPVDDPRVVAAAAFEAHDRARSTVSAAYDTWRTASDPSGDPTSAAQATAALRAALDRYEQATITGVPR